MPARPPYRPRHQGGADISTGLYTREDDDLFVNTAMPLILRRTYRTEDRRSRQFGVGAMHPGEWWLYGDNDKSIPWGDLILADGGRIHFTRISPGSSQEDAVLRHDATPTEFNGALLSWNGSRWEMRFRDGGLALFLDCQGVHDVCSLVERRDANGHRIVYERDPSGTLLKMESEGQSIAFEYDDHKRIVRASDTSQHAIVYTYDDSGRLVRARSSNGTIRQYAYDDRDALIAIHEPGRIVRNWYDESGRFARQEVRNSESDNDPYVVTVRYVVNGDSIVQTDLDEGDGIERTRYNSHHYVVSETFDANGPSPITFDYRRDPTTNAVSRATMSCRGPEGPVTRSVALAGESDRRAKEALIRETCVLRRR
jgi:YD repeat-containing protein